MSKWYEFKASASGQETELLLYGEIGGWGITAESFMADLKQIPKNHRINLRIYSPGGSVFDGNVIFGALQRHPGGVTTHIDGLAASMASIIALAGQPVKMASNALYMIHNVSGGTYGDADDMRKTADLLDKIQATLVSAYEAKTKLPKEDIIDMMNQETWFTAEEAKEKGFIDEVTSAVQMAAKFDLSRFKNAPKFDTAPKATTSPMIIETPEYLALQAEHKNQAHELATIKADLESAMSVNRELLDKVALFEANNKEAEATIAKLTEDIATKATEHATAVADFDKKVGEKAAALLAQTGTTPIKLGSTFTADTAAVYEEFKAADPLKARAMLNDPNTGPLIRLESAKRNQ